jgi:hypothetical protein
MDVRFEERADNIYFGRIQIRQKRALDEAHFDQLEDLLEELKSWSARELALCMGIRYPNFETLETQLVIEIRVLNDGHI